MRKRISLALITLSLAFALEVSTAQAVGFNSAMLFRYPWAAGTMTRTQGQFSSPSHNGLLQYAVDWDNATGHWLALSANGGTIKCNAVDDGIQETFGNYIGTYNSTANKMSVYAHLENCGFFVPGSSYDGTQGQPLTTVSNTGCAGCGIHLHFHVVQGSNLTGTHTTVSFEMSDRSSFTGDFATDGPSDNAGVGYAAGGVLDNTIRATYLDNGGASGSWWNIGATYATGIGPCVFSNNPLVHTCGSRYGTFTVQNYIRWDSLNGMGIAKNSAGSAAYKLVGANWRLMGNPFRTTSTMTNELGHVGSNETSSSGSTVQYFAGGHVINFTSSVRQDVVLLGVWRATFYFRDLYGECYDVNSNGAVTISDSSAVSARLGTVEGGGPNGGGYYYSPLYDLNRTGSITNDDANLVNAQIGWTCSP